MKDCKYCDKALACDNPSNICYQCATYKNYAEEQKTEWLSSCAANPTKYMLDYHIEIILDVIRKRIEGE